jgi:hypothetical protein
MFVERGPADRAGGVTDGLSITGTTMISTSTSRYCSRLHRF